MDFNMNFDIETLNGLREVFRDVLGVEPEKINEKTTYETLKEWDSMKHLELIMGVESKFSVEFMPHEVILLNSIERLMSAIEKKRGK